MNVRPFFKSKFSSRIFAGRDVSLDLKEKSAEWQKSQTARLVSYGVIFDIFLVVGFLKTDPVIPAVSMIV